ncbi:MAG TPA: aldose 1-epimerase [Candidatus Acidoferrales bacterium]|nr:aldose 1-epimerase [Candidatus Acidoferrales bacterium]
MKDGRIKRTAAPAIVVLAAALAVGTAPARRMDVIAANAPPSQVAVPVTIGGEPPVILKRPRSLEANKPQFLEAVVLPGMGMNLFQIKAYVPGKGDIDLLNTMDLAAAKAFLETGDDEFGNNAFKTGGAMLLPYAGLIRGKLSPDGKTIGAFIDGHHLFLPANWHGAQAGAEPVAMNGLILTAKFQNAKAHDGPQESTVFGLLRAGNFGGRWLSETNLNIGMTLKDDSLDVYVIAKNVGAQEEPMAIGFQPYFQIPSGDRKQARLHIPADMRAPVNNYDDAFPTGRIVPVKGTAYDFTAPEGKALGELSMNDCFTNLDYDPDRSATIELTDPASKFGLRIRALSPHIKAIEIYAPPDKPFVVIDPRFNLPDPYRGIWHGQDTGIVLLQPEKTTMWHARIEIFKTR